MSQPMGLTKRCSYCGDAVPCRCYEEFPEVYSAEETDPLLADVKEFLKTATVMTALNAEAQRLLTLLGGT